MESLTQLASRSIEPGPVRPATGPWLPAIAVSSAVHLSLALLGVAWGVSESAKLQLHSGRSVSKQTVTLSATQSPPHAAVAVMQTRGVDTTERQPVADSIQPVEPIALPQLPEIESPAAADIPTQGQPEAMPSEVSEPMPPLDKPPEETAVEEETDVEELPTEKPTPQPPAEAEATTQASDQTPGARVDVAARPLPTNHPPAYPRRAIAENREGRAILRVVVDAAGTAREVTLLKSSGHDDLDATAIAAVANWRFAPALRNQTAVEQIIAVPIRFVNRP